MSADESITSLPDAVAAMGALPMPVAPEPQALPWAGPICTQAEARAAGLDIAPSVEELDAMASSIVAAGDPLSAEVSLAQAVPLLGAAVTGLRARVAELEAQREVLAERLRAGQQWRQGRNPELVSENFVSQSELRSIFGIPLVAPWADRLTQTFSPVASLREPEGEFYAFLHKGRVPHDLPETGGEVRG